MRGDTKIGAAAGAARRVWAAEADAEHVEVGASAYSRVLRIMATVESPLAYVFALIALHFAISRIYGSKAGSGFRATGR